MAEREAPTDPVLGDRAILGLPTVSFDRFAETADRIAATTKRNEKAAILGEYFSSLSDDDLALAARYFAGYVFPLHDQRTTNVGGSALLSAIEAASGVDPEFLRARLVQLGDLGDAAGDAFAARGDKQQPGLTLQHVAAAFEELAETSGAKRKVELLIELLSKARPAEARYIVKLLTRDLRIGLREGAVEDALARLFGVKADRVQWANMLTGDIGEAALLTRLDRLAEARMRLFHPVKFMLASPAADLVEVAKQMPEQFLVEDKFDGIRAQAHVARSGDEESSLHGIIHNGVRVALFSRTLDEITRSFPELIAPLAALAEHADGLILDGEIVPVRGEEVLPFQELQKRLGRKTPSEELRTAVPVAFFAFDVLYADNRVLLNEQLGSRRAVLEGLPFTGQVRRPDSKRFTDPSLLDEEFEAARARGNEGLMIKNPASGYKPGRRGRDWLKLKRALASLDVVVTAVEVGHGKRRDLLSDYTFAVRASEDDPTLLNVGKAYSGLTDSELTELTEWFRAHTIKEFAHGRVRLVEPRVVIEVTFDVVQRSNRHKSGYALRFPRILRLRPDKGAHEIDTLDTVRRLAEPRAMSSAGPDRDDSHTPDLS